MTADIDLLPLPEWAYGNNHLRIKAAGLQSRVTDYARANMEPLLAEIDALRTRLEDTVRDSTNEIETLRAEREVIGAEAVKYAGKSGRLEAKVDRLADALLELCNVIDGHEVPVAVEGKAAHARAALRDHDQEGGNP